MTRRLGALAAVAVATAAGAAALFLLRRPAATPATRGARLAAELGCFACHGPGGTGGVANPGSVDPEVPAWDGGVAMMYVEREEEIREWILFGAPTRLRDAASANAPTQTRALIAMPAYQGRVSGGELAELIAYFKAVAGFERWPEDEQVRAGYRAASRHGCFGCHGPGGRLALPNPGSWKGVIPAWQGDDFGELVRDDAELRSWILDGGIARLEEHPIARRFLARQVIAMPAYRDHLDDQELDAIVAYIDWLRSASSGPRL